MTLLQKKCFVAAAGLHVLLVLILVVGPGFRSRPKVETFTPITMLPASVVDGPSRGGSLEGGQTPPVAETPPQKPAEEHTAVAEPPKPAPPEPVKPEEPVREAPPVKPVPRPVPAKSKFPTKPRDPTPPLVKNPKNTIKVDLSSTSDSKEKQRVADAAAKAEAKAQANRLKQIHDTFSSVSGGLAKTIGDKTAKTEPALQLGEGSGGPVFAGYADLILTIYKSAWDTDNLHLTVLHASTAVEVTVTRNGSIISSKITRRSGESALDKSVEKALHRVTHLPSFPSDSTDAQRTFSFTFDPEAKL